MFLALMSIASILIVIAWIWLIILAFSKSVVWGIFSIIPLIGLIFGLMHFKMAQTPTIMMIIGIVLNIVGQSMAGPIIITN
jgi:hypothetical protein